ncbi:choline/carnitine O-acyltransferase [Neisseria sp. Ec49-e6-T10]|uniref:choline/carnitine O-acyltransferase n=1 Tax=Neisseria sp. Ec49-e6-T10 TaxID=3140744 RepID=UPI003EB9D03C
MMTFSNDCTLPALPLPELKESINQIKELIKPLVDDVTWQQSCVAADAVAIQAATLQQELSEYRHILAKGNSWLRPFWDESYLSSRSSLPLNVNYFIELRTEQMIAGIDDSNVKLATFLLALCRQFQAIATNKIPNEVVHGQCLSMDQLDNMLYSRIAALNSDMLMPVSVQGQICISVVCRGYWYLLCVSDVSGQFVTSNALASVLQDIRTDAMSNSDMNVPIGAMCVATRDEAALIRQELCSNLQNRLSLRDLEHSLFTLCLDEPGTQPFADTLLGGPTENRWYDKSLQVIADDAGHIGLNIEHSGCDAGIWLYLLQCVYEENAQTVLQSEHHLIQPQFRQLKWQINPSLSDQLKYWHQKQQADYASIGRSFYENTDINREQIKGLGCSPDAFLQCCWQLAYYQLSQEMVSVYEAVAVRGFYQGRTECARPLTEQMASFIQQSFTGGVSKDSLKASFLLMEQAHKARLKRCQQGMGSERHMTGLYYMSMLNNTPTSKLPELFNDTGWQKLIHNTISTSSIAAPFIRFFGFGPVENDGLGIGYGLTSTGLQLVVTSAKNSKVGTEDFIRAFEAQSNILKDILSS